MTTKQATSAQIEALRQKDRAVIGWVLAPVIEETPNGPRAVIERIAQVTIVFPPRGQGERPLHVGVVDFGSRDDSGSPARYIGSAGGCGYDKLAAAMDGMTVGGVTLGDHCDPVGNPTLEVLCNRLGWTWIRGY